MTDIRLKKALKSLSINKLNRLGIYEITGMDITDEYCTYKQKNNFYSYRRDGLTGRMIGAIGLK